MKAFEYVAPNTIDGAVDRLRERSGEAQPLAGGMDLLGMMKDYVAQPERLVSLNEIGDLRGISRGADGTLHIGALVTMAELAADPTVHSEYPGLAEAAATVGTPQIRNRGTLGGNLCQRPRCWYFRSEHYDCLRKGGTACFAVDGDNRYHAIFDTAPCPIVHPSNCAVALVAYGATVHTAGASSGNEPAARHSIPIDRFFIRPARDITRENILPSDEVVTGVELPPSDGMRSASYVVKHKQSHDWPLAMASVAFELAGNTVGDARVVLGSVAPTPWRSVSAERALRGQSISVQTAEAVADAAVADAEPLEHNAYKVRIARTAVKRAILEAAGIDWATA